jgi:prophage tail gpP-like protein
VNNVNNNILAGSATFDFKQRFNSYHGYSQANSVAFIDTPQTPQQLTNKRGGTGADAEIRATRQYNFISEKASDDNDLKNRAIWEANIRRATSKTQSCTVQGFRAEKDGIIWRPNLLVRVDDEFTNTSGTFLIKDVTYNYALDGGSFTTLTLVAKDAFTLQAEQDQRESRVNTQGKGYVV